MYGRPPSQQVVYLQKQPSVIKKSQCLHFFWFIAVFLCSGSQLVGQDTKVGHRIIFSGLQAFLRDREMY